MGIIRYKIIFGEYLRGLRRIMKCKKCKADIPDELHPVYCCYCGEKLQRERKKKDEIKIPTPRKRGQKWYVDLRREGVMVIEATEAAAIAKAQAIRAGFVPVDKKHASLTLRKAIENYIADRDNVLSPSTIRGYEAIKNSRFKKYIDADISAINWQAAINDEAKLYSPKTVKNEYGLIRSVLRSNGLALPNVTLPQAEQKQLAWLDYEQIQTFINAIRNEPCEMAALFALHSLRRSELLAITPSKIIDGCICVDGSRVFNKDNELIEKSTNKNTASKRNIKIMIPRLAELIAAYDGDPDEPFISCYANTIWAQINTICAANGLPKVGVHGLRRSFASLAYHLGWSERQTMRVGGWSDVKTVHNIYIKLSESDVANDIQKMAQFYEFTT